MRRRLATAIRLENEHNLNVTARMLLNGDFTFCPVCDFNELAVAKKSTRQLLRDQLHNERLGRQHSTNRIRELRKASACRAETVLTSSSTVALACGRTSTDIVVPEFRRQAADRPVSDHACRTMFEKVRARLDLQDDTDTRSPPTNSSWAAAQDDPQPPLSQSDSVQWHKAAQPNAAGMSAAGGS